MSGQDTLFLRGGIYTNDWKLDGIPSGASWSAMTVVKSFPGELAVIKPATHSDVAGFLLTSGSYICLESLDIDMTNTVSTQAGIKITDNANHVRITNCAIHGIYSGHGILLSQGTPNNADDNQIFNCSIYYAGWIRDGRGPSHGIYLHSRRNLIAGCALWQNESHGIHNSDGNPEGTIILNTSTHDNGSIGIGFHTSGSISGYVANCQGFSEPTGFMTSSSATNIVFINCSAWDNSVAYNVKEDSGGGIVFKNDIAYRNTGNDRSSSFRNLSTYPFTVEYCLSASNTINSIYSATSSSYLSNYIGDSFGIDLVDWRKGTNNFILADTSQAIDKGESEGVYAFDLFNRIRPYGPAWDIGAFEWYTNYIGNSAAGINVTLNHISGQ